MMLCNAFEDAMGRTVGARSNPDSEHKRRRENAAKALVWLRSAGRGDLAFGTPDHCAHVLNLDARWLVWNGVARLSGSGLKNWRKWKAERNECRVKPLPVQSKECRYCHCTFTTKHERRQFCSTRCCNASRRQQPEQQQAQPIHMGARGYRGFVDYCALLGLQPAEESWWRLLAG
jgi:hypothetical protein